MEISEKLKILREEHNLTQEELAKKIKVCRTTITNYENGNRTPDNKILISICDFFNITVDSLYTEETIYKSKNKDYSKFKIISIISLIFIILIIGISKFVKTEYNYGYDINDPKLKVYNSEVISVVKFINKETSNTYKVDVVENLKGYNISYITLYTNHIKVDYNKYYLVFGNLIKNDKESSNYVSIDAIEIYDYQFIYELNDYNNTLSLHEGSSNNALLTFYNQYINNSKKDNIVYTSLNNVRTKEYVISSKDIFSNPYDYFDLENDFGISFTSIKKDKRKYMDIELSLKVKSSKDLLLSFYLYTSLNNEDKHFLRFINYNVNNFNMYKYDEIILKFNNIPISYYEYNTANRELVIRYGHNNLINSNWTNKDLSIKIGYKY